MVERMDLIKINLPVGLSHSDPQIENLEFIFSINESHEEVVVTPTMIGMPKYLKDDHFLASGVIEDIIYNNSIFYVSSIILDFFLINKYR